MANGGEIRVSLTIDDQLSGGLRQADSALLAFAGNADRAIMSLGRLAPAAAGVVAIGLAARASVQDFANYQQQLANLGSVMDTTPKQLQAIGKEQLALSRSTVFTAQQIGEASYMIGKSGADAASLQKELPDVLNLASASMSDATLASRLYVAAQKDFGLTSKDSTAIVDDLARSIDSSVGNMTQWATAYKQIGPVAKSAGMDYKELDTTIGSLMNSGLQGDAGTALKVFIQRINSETPAAKKVVSELGLQFFDTAGNMKSMVDIANELHEKMRGLTEQEKQAAMTTIFGTRGVRVAAIMEEQGAQPLLDTQAHKDTLGSAADLAHQKLMTLSGDIHQFQSSLNTMAVQVGSTLAPTFDAVMKGAKFTSDALSRVPTPIMSTVEALGAMVLVQKVATAGADALIGRYGSFSQVVAAQGKPISDRTAAVQLYNQVLDKAATQEEIISQKAADNPLYGNSKSYSTDEARLDQLYQQRNLLERGATTAQVQVFAQRQAAYNADLSSYENYLTKRQTFDNEEAVRVQKSQQKFAQDFTSYQQKMANFNQGQGPAPGQPPDPSKYKLQPEQFGGQVVSMPLEVKPSSVRVNPLEVAKEAKGAIIGALGTLTAEISIVLIAKQMIIDPINAQEAKIAADKIAGTFDPKNLKGMGNDVLPSAVSAYVKQQQQIAATEDADASSFMGRAEKVLKFGSETSREAAASRAKSNADAALKYLQQRLDEAKQEAQNIREEITNEFDNLLKKADQGKIGYDDAIDQIRTREQSYAASVKKNGLQPNAMTPDDYTSMGETEVRIIKQAQIDKANMEVAAEALQNAAGERAAFAKQLNVPQAMISADMAGDSSAKKFIDQQITAYRNGTEQLKKELSDMAQAATEAQGAIDKIDFTKGFGGIEKAIPDLEKAKMALAEIGADTSAVDTLLSIGKAFENLKSKFEASGPMVNFRGNMAMLNETDSEIKMLDDFGKKVKEVSDYAQEAKDHGVATPDQLSLLKSESNILDHVGMQMRQLAAVEAGDVLNIAKNLPDMVKYNEQIRALATSMGGVATVQRTIETQSQRATDAALDVKDITKAVQEHPDMIKLMINDDQVKKDIDAMGGDLTKLTENDWRVIVSAIMGNSVESLKTLQGILDAVPSVKSIAVQLTMDKSAQNFVNEPVANNINPADLAGYQQAVSDKTASDQQRQNNIKYTVSVDTTIADSDMGAFRNKAETPLTAFVDANVSAAYAAISGIAGYAASIHPVVTITTQNVTVGVPGGGGNGSPGSNYADGGDVAGDFAIVGDGAGGSINNTTEVVDFRNRRVYSNKQARAMGMFGKSMPHYDEGIDATTPVGAPWTGNSSWGNKTAADFDKATGAVKGTTKAAKDAEKATKDVAKAAQDVAKATFDASAAAAELGQNITRIDPTNLKQLGTYFTQFASENKRAAEASLPTNATQEQRSQADAGAMEKTLNQTMALSRILMDANMPLEQQRQLWGEIEQSLGPIGPLVHQQVDYYQAIQSNLAAIKSYQAEIKDLDEKHNQTLRDRADAERTYSRGQEDSKNAISQYSTMVSRMNTIQQEGIQASRTRAQRYWEDQQKGIQDGINSSDRAFKAFQDNEANKKDAEDNAWIIRQRQFEDAKIAEDNAWKNTSRNYDDQKRFLDFYGTKRQKELQDEIDLLQKQYKQITANGATQEQYLSARVKGAQTNQEAFGLATQLAAMKDLDATRKEAEKTAEQNMKDALDDEKKLATQQKFDLETQRLAEERLHEDRLTNTEAEKLKESRKHENTDKNIDSEIKAEQTKHDVFLQTRQDELAGIQESSRLTQRYWADEDTARTNAHTRQQWMIEDIQQQQSMADQAHKRELEDAQTIEDRAYEDSKKQTQDSIDKLTEQNKDFQDNIDALGSVMNVWSQLSQYAGETADKLLAPLAALVGSGAYTAPAPHARGGVGRGLSLVGEDGPELFTGDGVFMDATSTASIIAAAIGMGSSGGTTVVHMGTRNYNISGGDTAALVRRIEVLEAKIAQDAKDKAMGKSTGGKR